MKIAFAGGTTAHASLNTAVAHFERIAGNSMPMKPADKPKSPPPPTSPAEVATGDVNYYAKRNEDFIRRNPGMTPPPYYMEYGNKYAHRFNDLGSSNLSPAGLAWRDRALKALQEAMETKRRADPEGFAALERDPEAFKKFAYDTHPNAYIESGLFNLSAQDIAAIATTPDLGDIFTPDGIKGVLDAAAQLRPEDVGDIAVATVVDGNIGTARAVFTEMTRLPAQLSWLIFR